MRTVGFFTVIVTESVFAFIRTATATISASSAAMEPFPNIIDRNIGRHKLQ